MKDDPAFPTIKTEIENYEFDDSAGSFGGTELRQREAKRYLPGLTKREYIAAMALQGLLSDSKLRAHPQAFAESSVRYADELIKELEKTK